MLPPMAPSIPGRPAMQALKRSGLSGCSSTCVAESANPSWHCSKHKRNGYPMPKNSHSIPMSQDCLSRHSDPIGSCKTIKCFVSSSVIGVLVTLTLNQPIHLGTLMISPLHSFPRLHKHNNPKSGLTAQFKTTWTERSPWRSVYILYQGIMSNQIQITQYTRSNKSWFAQIPMFQPKNRSNELMRF